MRALLSFSQLILASILCFSTINALDVDLNEFFENYPSETPKSNPFHGMTPRELWLRNPYYRQIPKNMSDYIYGVLNVINTQTFDGTWYTLDKDKVADKKWYALQNKHILKKFENDKGHVQSQPIASGNVDSRIQGLNFALDIQDGSELANQKIVALIGNNGNSFNFNIEETVITGRGVFVNVRHHTNGGKNISGRYCRSFFQIQAMDANTGKPLQMQEGGKFGEFTVNFTLISPQCNIFIQSNQMAHYTVSSSEIFVYIALMSMSALFGMFASKQLSDLYPHQTEELKNVSIWSLCMCNAWDFYLFVFHFTTSLVVSGYLAIVALMYFFLSTIFQTKALYSLLFGPYADEYDTSRQRRTLILYYVLMMALNLSFVTCTFSNQMTWLFLLAALYLFPQIIHVFRRGRAYRYKYSHIFGFMFSKLVFIVYINYYPKNVLNIYQNVYMAEIFIGILLAQIVVLLIQSKLPKLCWTPPLYEYRKRIYTIEEREEVCCICMGALDPEAIDTTMDESCILDPENPAKERTKSLLGRSASVDIYETPCRHRFHEICLKSWAKNKLECPLDRTEIPPFSYNGVL